MDVAFARACAGQSRSDSILDIDQRINAFGTIHYSNYSHLTINSAGVRLIIQIDSKSELCELVVIYREEAIPAENGYRR